MWFLHRKPKTKAKKCALCKQRVAREDFEAHRLMHQWEILRHR